GASRNIGRAIALAFAAEGADLVLNTRANGDELDAVAGACRKAGVRVVRALADVADATAVDTMVTRALAELGAIDVLVCHAATRRPRAAQGHPASPARPPRRYRRGVRLPRLRRIFVRDRRHDPGHGRSHHRIVPGG